MFTGVTMMYQDLKLKVYQGIIQYLLSNTGYSLKRIASFSCCSLKTIRSIYTYSELPSDTSSEINLVRLFQIILELEKQNEKPVFAKHKSNFINPSGANCIV